MRDDRETFEDEGHQGAGQPLPEPMPEGRENMEDAEDARLVELLRDAADHYHVPAAAPPFDTMWARIEAAHFGPAPGVVPAAPTAPTVVRGLAGRRLVARWGGPALGLAAGLLLGVGVGAGLWRRAEPAGGAPLAAAGEAPRWEGAAPRLDPAYESVATEYFDQAVALLAALPSRLEHERPDARLAAQARDLLSTTRLLLDSPAAGADPELQALLDDLELVLAQLVRLPAVQDSSQAALINEALETRDVLPRLRSAAAQASSADHALGAD